MWTMHMRPAHTGSGHRPTAWVGRFSVVALILLTLLSLATLSPRGDGRPVRADNQPTVCTASFEYAVRQGPSAGMQAQGTLTLPVDSTGAITDGSFITPDGAVIRVTGQASGQAISLLFDLGDGHYLYGVGVLENDLSQCAGTLGGPLVGPQPGDAGDWIGGAMRPAPCLVCVGPQPTLSPTPAPAPTCVIGMIQIHDAAYHGGTLSVGANASVTNCLPVGTSPPPGTLQVKSTDGGTAATFPMAENVIGSIANPGNFVAQYGAVLTLPATLANNQCLFVAVLAGGKKSAGVTLCAGT